MFQKRSGSEITVGFMKPRNLFVVEIRGTNGQSPSQGGAVTPGDMQAEKVASGLRCPECGVKFETPEDLESHVQTDHPEVSPETSTVAKKAEASPVPKVSPTSRDPEAARSSDQPLGIKVCP